LFHPAVRSGDRDRRVPGPPDRFRRIAWWQFRLGAAQFWGSLAGLLLAFAWSHY